MKYSLPLAFILLSATAFALSSNSTDLCLTNADCSFRGQCDTRTNECVCDDGWTTHHDDRPCNYKKKSQAVAFPLHLLFGFAGAGHWYLDNTAKAAAQLSLFSGAVALGLASAAVGAVGSGCSACCQDALPLCVLGLGGSLPLGALAIALGSAWTVWWAVDNFLFGLNYYQDGNNQNVQAW